MTIMTWQVFPPLLPSQLWMLLFSETGGFRPTSVVLCIENAVVGSGASDGELGIILDGRKERTWCCGAFGFFFSFGE